MPANGIVVAALLVGVATTLPQFGGKSAESAISVGRPETAATPARWSMALADRPPGDHRPPAVNGCQAVPFVATSA